MGKQGTKLTFLARSHLAPKFSKVVAKAKKLGAIKKKKVVEKICVVSKRDISLHNIQRNIWKSKMADVDMFGS